MHYLDGWMEGGPKRKGVIAKRKTKDTNKWSKKAEAELSRRG